MADEAKKTEVSQDFLSDFLNASKETTAEGSEQLSSLDNKIAEAFEKALSWGIDKLDKSMKNEGLPGIEQMDPDEVAELMDIVLVKNFGNEFKRYSPEGMLAIVIGGTAFSNFMAWKRLQAEQEQQEKKQADKSKKEAG